MCGIAGLLDPTLAGQGERLHRIGRAMAGVVAHRGPDGEGVWVDESAGLVLAQRRLAVIDLSPAGDQPMMSADGRWVIDFNGEIYNTAEMMRTPELRECRWRGHSDTEVLLESFARRGIERTLADVNGMFAIALWDRAERTLYLMRDHMGIKPLFVLNEGGRIAFASELKCFSRLERWSPEIDLASLTSYFRFGCVPAPFSIYRGISKLMPGELMIVAQGRAPARRRFWSLAAVAGAGTAQHLDVSDAEAVEMFDRLLRDSVERQMISDVPLGVFLSGGIDSSTVTALMVQAGRGAVRTFSVGSPDLAFDESRHAAPIARHLGTAHTQLTVSADAALEAIPMLPAMYDEPFADSSQIPTYLICKLTRQHVTVALSGDGGDEILAGYNRHVFVERYWKYLEQIPVRLRAALSLLLRQAPERACALVQLLLPARHRPALLREKMQKLVYVLPADSRELYTRLISLCFDPSRLTGAAEHEIDLAADAEARLGSRLAAMQLRDMMLYLPDDILQKVDRASMAVSLEVRPPLLDRRIVEWTWRLPDRFKIRNGESKWLLRRVLERYVPRPLFERPKMGFSIPLAAWLLGPLRTWVEDLLDPATFGGGLVDVAAARRLHQDFLNGHGVSAHTVWTLLMFEAWRRRWAA
jgi:asparagine synthase (glutamine-hydrolysing)